MGALKAFITGCDCISLKFRRRDRISHFLKKGFPNPGFPDLLFQVWVEPPACHLLERIGSTWVIRVLLF
jgi:hypothetical protein